MCPEAGWKYAQQIILCLKGACVCAIIFCDLFSVAGEIARSIHSQNRDLLPFV
jgi:hypothetical protein